VTNCGDLETIRLAADCAETGPLMIGSTCTPTSGGKKPLTGGDVFPAQGKNPWCGLDVAEPYKGGYLANTDEESGLAGVLMPTKS